MDRDRHTVSVPPSQVPMRGLPASRASEVAAARLERASQRSTRDLPPTSSAAAVANAASIKGEPTEATSAEAREASDEVTLIPSPPSSTVGQAMKRSTQAVPPPATHVYLGNVLYALIQLVLRHTMVISML